MENSEIKFLDITDKDEECDELQELFDGKLLTSDGYGFRIHKIILARASDYFRAMFCGINKDKKDFTIPNVKGECLRDILYYLYTGNMRVTERNVVDLLIATDYLLLKDVYLKMKENLTSNMTVFNCFEILKTADLINDKEMYEDCFRFILIGFEWIMRCNKGGVVDLPFEILEAMLCSRSLYVLSERTVWQTIVEWTQNDIPHRLISVPRLLQSLAIAEVEEELAADILRHEIVTKNDSLKDLNGVKFSNDFINNLQIFSNLLCNYLSYISEPCHFRIPIKMHVVSLDSNLYVSYDENTDIWNKITEFSFQPDRLSVIGHNIFTFEIPKIEMSDTDEEDDIEEFNVLVNVIDENDIEENDIEEDDIEEDDIEENDIEEDDIEEDNLYEYNMDDDIEEDNLYEYNMDDDIDEEEQARVLGLIIYKKFDLSRMDWVPMEGCRYLIYKTSVVTIGQCMYVLGFSSNNSCHVLIYFTEINRWFHDSSLKEFSYGFAVSIEKKIYLVGRGRNLPTTKMYVFDTVSKQWSLLSSPNVNRKKYFALEKYRQKIYVIGGSVADNDRINKAEVYDPATNHWKELPDVPHSYIFPAITVLKDQMLVYEKKVPSGDFRRIFRWHFEKECWEHLEETSQLQDLLYHSAFCTTDNVETIKMMTKRNRDPKNHLQKVNLKF